MFPLLSVTFAAVCFSSLVFSLVYCLPKAFD